MALKIHITFVDFQFRRYVGALKAVTSKAVRITDELPRRQAIKYVNLLRENISIGRYYGQIYSPYSPRYLKWKRTVFKSTHGFWRLKGHLLSSLIAYRVRFGWMGGVPPGRLVEGSSWFGEGHTGQPRYIAQYASWMEYGRRGQPPRPLFRPTLDRFAPDEGRREAIRSLNELARRWD